MATSCPICKGELWVCEAHELTPWSKCGCGAPGVPCRCNPAERMPPDVTEICSTDDPA